jgi:hypothetical protein
MTMSERTVAIVEPDTTKGVVVNVEVVAPDWVNNDPAHYIEYDETHPAAIGWEVVDGVVIVPPPPPPPPSPDEE